MPRPHRPNGIEETHPGSNFTDAENEFMFAMERYRRIKNRRFPTCREVLQVLTSLGYRKSDAPSAEPH